jgi:hypothetical protein
MRWLIVWIKRSHVHGSLGAFLRRSPSTAGQAAAATARAEGTEDDDRTDRRVWLLINAARGIKQNLLRFHVDDATRACSHCDGQLRLVEFLKRHWTQRNATAHAVHSTHTNSIEQHDSASAQACSAPTRY